MQEFEFIKRCTEFLPNQAEGLLCGIGDDCAIITGSMGRDWLISTDGFFEGVHFRRDWMGAKDIGRRCLVAAVSDIAAMGGRPRFVTVSIAVPEIMTEQDATEAMSGIASTAASYQMVVIGGDTCASRKGLGLTLTVIGDVRHGGALYRRGARVGDTVYVTGELGGAAANRLLHPIARISSGQWLGDTGCVTAMIDVSDGLVQDLGHIAKASNVGMVIDSDAVPRWRGDGGPCDLAAALTGGEEFELAFTVDSLRDAAFQRLLPAVLGQLGHPITRVGIVGTGSGVIVRDKAGQDFTPQTGGYRHAIGMGGRSGRGA